MWLKLDSKIDFASSASTFSKNKTIMMIKIIVKKITTIKTIMHSRDVHCWANM